MNEKPDKRMTIHDVSMKNFITAFASENLIITMVII